MESIRKYIARFLKCKQFNTRYDICFHEVVACKSAFKENPIDTINTIENISRRVSRFCPQ